MPSFPTPPPLDRLSTIPLYRQVERYLRRQIERGAIEPGNMLPSVKILCQEFGGLNHLTVRQALKELADEGLVESVRGRGTFVTGPKRKVGRIALVLPTLNDFLTTNISQSVQAALAKRSYRTIVMDSRGNGREELDNIRQLADLPLDGAIILPVKYGDLFEEIYRLKVDGFPFVLVDRYFYDIEVPSVVVDNYNGTFDLTSHLVKQGKRRIAWVGRLGFSSAQDRFRGFCDALNEAGLCYKRELLRDGEDSVRATRELLALKDRPDAVVYVNDLGALAGLKEIQAAGLSIPEDVAVAGFDDIPEAAAADPPLTTVRQPMEQLGAEAAKLLLAGLEKPGSSPRKVVLPVEMVVRKST